MLRRAEVIGPVTIGPPVAPTVTGEWGAHERALQASAAAAACAISSDRGPRNLSRAEAERLYEVLGEVIGRT